MMIMKPPFNRSVAAAPFLSQPRAVLPQSAAASAQMLARIGADVARRAAAGQGLVALANEGLHSLLRTVATAATATATDTAETQRPLLCMCALV